MSENSETRLFLGGWICLWRRIANSTLWLDEKFTRGQAWIDILLLAQGVFASEVRDGQYREFKPGVVYWPISDLAKRWKWSRNTVTSYLKNLEKANMIVLESRPRQGTVIQIVNWSQYQEKGKTGKNQQNGTFTPNYNQQTGQRVEQIKSQMNQGFEASFEGRKNQASEQMIEQMAEQMAEHNITIYSKEKKIKNNSATPNLESPSSSAPLLKGGRADGSGKTKADIPAPWRDVFETYEDYEAWRNQ